MVDHDLLHRELAKLPAATAEDADFYQALHALSLHVEQLQDELQQGACVDAISAREIVAVSDLSEESRWPEFRPAVLASGFHAVAGAPISLDGQSIGAINLYANASRAWTTDEFAAARLLSDLAAGYLINRELLRTTQTLAAQLQHALDSRVIIEQAKGMLAGRHGMSTDAAFEVLRSYSRSNRIKLHEVAAAVVRGQVDLEDGQGADALGGSSPSTS